MARRHTITVALERCSLNIKGIGPKPTAVTELGFVWTVMGAGTPYMCCRRLAFYAYPDSNRAPWDVLCGVDTQRAYGMMVDFGMKQISWRPHCLQDDMTLSDPVPVHLVKKGNFVGSKWLAALDNDAVNLYGPLTCTVEPFTKDKAMPA